MYVILEDTLTITIAVGFEALIEFNNIFSSSIESLLQ